MPRKTYRPLCECPPAPTQGDEPTCRECGARKEYTGIRFSMIEAMTAFSMRTGLPPMGEDRKTPAAKAILERMVRCPLCEGGRVIEDFPSETWAFCPVCGGLGSALDGEFDPSKGNLLSRGILILRKDGSVEAADDGEWKDAPDA